MTVLEGNMVSVSHRAGKSPPHQLKSWTCSPFSCCLKSGQAPEAAQGGTEREGLRKRIKPPCSPHPHPRDSTQILCSCGQILPFSGCPNSEILSPMPKQTCHLSLGISMHVTCYVTHATLCGSGKGIPNASMDTVETPCHKHRECLIVPSCQPKKL